MFIMDDVKIRKVAELLKTEIKKYRKITKLHSSNVKALNLGQALYHSEELRDEKMRAPGHNLLCEIQAQMDVLNIIGGYPLGLKLCEIMEEFDEEEKGKTSEFEDDEYEEGHDEERGQGELERHNYVSFFDYAAHGIFDGWVS